jgi:hypothetical protein
MPGIVFSAPSCRGIGSNIMKRHILVPLACAALVSCGAPLKTEGPQKVDNLVGALEQVYVEAELSREKLTAAMDRLQVIAAAEFDEGDAAAAYAEFVAALAESQQQAKLMKASIGPMKESAAPIFATWEGDVSDIENETLRERSEERLERTREKFEAIVSNVESTQEKFDALNEGMQDHALFLHNDLNGDSLALIQGEVKKLVELAAEVDEGYETAMTSSRAYIDTTALPLSSATARYEARVEAARERNEASKPRVRRVSARGSAR